MRTCRAGQLRRLELQGPRALDVLSAALPLLSEPSGTSQHQAINALPQSPQQQLDADMPDIGVAIGRPQDPTQGARPETVPGICFPSDVGMHADDSIRASPAIDFVTDVQMDATNSQSPQAGSQHQSDDAAEPVPLPGYPGSHHGGKEAAQTGDAAIWRVLQLPGLFPSTLLN